MYLAIGSRPDISYAVGMLSKFSINPSAVHLAAVKRLLRYIKGTMHLGLYYHSVVLRISRDSAIQTLLGTHRTLSQLPAMSLPLPEDPFPGSQRNKVWWHSHLPSQNILDTRRPPGKPFVSNGFAMGLPVRSTNHKGFFATTRVLYN